jgi:hypothetical protein
MSETSCSHCVSGEEFWRSAGIIFEPFRSEYETLKLYALADGIGGKNQVQAIKGTNKCLTFDSS